MRHITVAIAWIDNQVAYDMVSKTWIAQSAGAVEYTDCTSAEG